MDAIQLKAMILAAGRGVRMKPLSDNTPKPLLKVGGISLLERHITCLKKAGFENVIINVSYLADQIINFCKERSNLGVRIEISREDEPLETAGGVIKALPLLGNSPFLLINADIWTDFDFEEMSLINLKEGSLAHLVLVNNPPEHTTGDFELDNFFVKQSKGNFSLTYSGIGIYNPLMFSGYKQSVCALRPILDSAIDRSLITGQVFRGNWYDIGTPDRLNKLNEAVNQL